MAGGKESERIAWSDYCGSFLDYSTLQDILSEIQRLKEEANRFIAILSREEEADSDENLSPAKKQTLTREVESLQVRIKSARKSKLKPLSQRSLNRPCQLSTMKVKPEKKPEYLALSVDVLARMQNT